MLRGQSLRARTTFSSAAKSVSCALRYRYDLAKVDLLRCEQPERDDEHADVQCGHHHEVDDSQRERVIGTDGSELGRTRDQHDVET